jgi:uncharacterized OsmC-like protein
MLLAILADNRLLLDSSIEDEELIVEGSPFGPMQMLAASLALCTASVIQSYATTASLDVDRLAIEVQWDFTEDPHRVGRFNLTLHLPDTVPAARHRAIIRAADTCTIHQTLSHSPAFETVVQTFTPREFTPSSHHHAEHHHAHET